MNSPFPVDVIDSVTNQPIQGASMVSTGTVHACAVVNGAAKCWGNDFNGQIGDQSPGDPSLKAADVQGLAGLVVTSISAGEQYSCAVVEGGMAACWGDNSFYKNGNGESIGSQALPGPVLQTP